MGLTIKLPKDLKGSIVPLLFPQVKAFLLDFDGTLARLNIDFKTLREEILNLASSFGLKDPLLPDPPYLLEMTLAVKEQLRYRNSGSAEAFFIGAMGLIDKKEWEAAHPENLFPATRFVLLELKKRGMVIAVLTRNSGKSVYRVFPDLDSYVDAFLPRERVSKPKPDPSHLQMAIKLLNVDPSQTVMVGDHPIDIHSGKKAGTLTIGVLTGRSSRAEMESAGADRVLENIGLIMDLVMIPE